MRMRTSRDSFPVAASPDRKNPPHADTNEIRMLRRRIEQLEHETLLLEIQLQERTASHAATLLKNVARLR